MIKDKRKRRGSILFVVVLSAVLALILSSVLKIVVHDVSEAKIRTESISDVYTSKTMADILVSAFCEDIEKAWATKAYDIQYDKAGAPIYEAAIADLSDAYMVRQENGAYRYVETYVPNITDFIDFDGPYASASMETKLAQAAKQIGDFEILSDAPLTADTFSADNILKGKSGDVYALDNFEFSLRFYNNGQNYLRTYSWNGLKVEFTVTETDVNARVNTDDATLEMLSQKLY